MELVLSVYQTQKKFRNGAGSYLAHSGNGEPVVAIMPDGEFKKHVQYVCTGYYKDGKYGRQFIVDAYAEDFELSERAVIHTLKEYPGIGEATAQLLYKMYSSETLRKIAEDPQILEKNSKIPLAECARISRDLFDRIGKSRVIMELTGLFDKAGFRKKLASVVYRRYGAKAPKILNRNPYVLLQYEGCGFTNVDNFALKNGYDQLSIKRQCYYLLYAMAGSSDVWVPYSDIHQWLTNQFGTAADVVRCLNVLLTAGRLRFPTGIERAFVGGQWLFALSADAENEREIVRFVSAKLNDSSQLNLEQLDLSASQFYALQCATRSGIGILTGGPGTGKTFTIVRLIQQLVAQGKSVAVIAPTGKAAVRIQETLDARNVDVAAWTIHSYLMPDGSLERFQFNENCPVLEQYVIVDESSMINAKLMRQLLAACYNSRVILVGDDGQLLPIGKGCPFADMISSRSVPVGKLTEIRRNSGAIVESCNEIRNGLKWFPEHVNNVNDATTNLVAIPSRDSTAGAVIGVLARLRDYIIRDVQTIVAVNKGAAGRELLNDAIKRRFNPGVDRYKVNDPVICLSNDKYNDYESGSETQKTADDSGTTRVMNGEIGYVIATSPKWTAVDYGDRQVVFRTADARFDLAYAVTCHKMQGSETKVAIVVIDDSYGGKMVCTREWVYTALSRAKELCILVGSVGVLYGYSQRTGNKRITRLSNYLQELKQ